MGERMKADGRFVKYMYARPGTAPQMTMTGQQQQQQQQHVEHSPRPVTFDIRNRSAVEIQNLSAPSPYATSPSASKTMIQVPLSTQILNPKPLVILRVTYAVDDADDAAAYAICPTAVAASKV